MHRALRRVLITSAVLLALSGGIAACSSSGSSDSSAASGSTSASSAGTIYFGTDCSVTGEIAQPACASVPEAYFDSLNAAGGIDGHHVSLVVCDNQSSEAQGADCAKQLADNSNVVAVIGDTIDPSMANYPIANIAPATVETGDLTSQYAFGLSPWALTSTWLNSIVAHAQAKYPNLKVAMLTCALAGCIAINNNLSALLKSKNIPLDLLTVPSTAATSLPELTAAQHFGANLVFVLGGDTGVAAAVTAGTSAGYSPQWATANNCYDQAFIDALPSSLTTSVWCTAPFTSWQGNDSQLVSTYQQYFHGPLQISHNAVDSWVAAHIAVDAVEQLHGNVTRQSLLAEMKKLPPFSSNFLSESVTFSQDGHNSSDFTHFELLAAKHDQLSDVS
jgi:branched-chain amino acid transport system substrate-binding protein